MEPLTVVVGAGALGGRFVRAWHGRHPDSQIVATVRREGRREELDLPGVRVVGLDLLHPEGATQLLAGARNLLVSVAPGPGVGDRIWSEGVPRLLECLDPRSRTQVVHISSTGVYAEDGGREVDEDAPLADSPRARALIAAERAVQDVSGTVLRCSGLVSSSRGPQNFAPRLAGAERPDGDGWLNLVWMDDVVEAIARAFEQRIAGVFNLSGSARRRREFYDPLLARAGLTPVRWVDGGTGGGKKVVCSRLEEQLGMRPRAVLPEDLGD